MASIAACLTILSYTATGVVSAVTAADYLAAAPFLQGIDVPQVHLAVLILAIFACLMLLGMKESSLVASIVFVAHLSTLFILAVAALIFVCQNGMGI